MRILDKYIIKSFLFPFFHSLCLFLFLYIIIDLFGHLDEILKHNIPILIIQEYYLSMTPLIIIQMLPVASLVSTIYVIGTMNKHDEITAMRTAGLSISRILLPFISIGLAISILSFAVSEKLLPIGMKNAQYIKQKYIEKAGTDKSKNVIDNIALYGKNDRLIFIKSYIPYDSTAKGITILRQDSYGNVIEKTNASEGKWKDSSWIFSDVLIYKLDENGAVKENPLFFEHKSLDMEGPKDLISKGANYEFMGFKDLSSYIQNFSSSSQDIINRLKVDLYQKTSLPFTSLVLILIGSAFALKIKRRGKTAALMGMGITIVIGFLYYALMATSIALGKSGLLNPFISAHLANILFGAIGIFSVRN